MYKKILIFARTIIAMAILIMANTSYASIIDMSDLVADDPSSLVFDGAYNYSLGSRMNDQSLILFSDDLLAGDTEAVEFMPIISADKPYDSVNDSDEADKLDSLQKNQAVATLPEPKLWAMLLIGILLVGYQVCKRGHSLSQSQRIG